MNETHVQTTQETPQTQRAGIISEAQAQFACSGELEIDADAQIIWPQWPDEPGRCVVQCWVWVDSLEVGGKRYDVDSLNQRERDALAEAYRAAASHPDAEVDSDALVSLGRDDGAYVQGWIGIDTEA